MLAANRASVRMLRFPDLDTLLKVNAADLHLNPEDRKRWRTMVERGGIVRDFVMHIQRYAGREIWVQNTAWAVRDNAGQALWVKSSNRFSQSKAEEVLHAP